jgi:hypothetical protein
MSFCGIAALPIGSERQFQFFALPIVPRKQEYSSSAHDAWLVQRSSAFKTAFCAYLVASLFCFLRPLYLGGDRVLAYEVQRADGLVEDISRGAYLWAPWCLIAVGG